MEHFARDRIARLRWRGGGDALAARRAAERSLGEVDWGWSGSAILCVRQLQGALRSHRGSGSPRWREQLQALGAAAARPWREVVPAAAPAVLFADEAELLACLARDAASGAAAGAWWWPALLGAQANQAVLLRHCHAAPALVPLALARLAARGAVAPVLHAFDESELRSITRVVAEHFSVDVHRAIASRVAASHAAAAASLLPAALRSEWHALRSNVEHVLGPRAASPRPAAARLLALALAVTQRPRLARAPGFPAALQSLGDDAMPAAWQAAQHSPPRVAPAPTPTLPSAPFAHAPLVQPGSGESPVKPTHSRHEPTRFDDATPAILAPAAAAAETTAISPASKAAGLPMAQAARSDVATASAPVTSLPHRSAQALVSGAAPLPALRVHSAFAGVFYLLPLAAHLGWYGDFTQPRHPGLGLHPADLLALLGERAAGACWADDPLRVLLAAWAGRAPDEPAGAGFDAGEPLADWLVEREACLARRAAAGLGWPQAEVVPRLVRQAGVASLDEMRLDVHYDLATHPLDIRIAGLDRDPGWLPAGGRTIAFHFELGLPR